jgi:hypothetical protein
MRGTISNLEPGTPMRSTISNPESGTPMRGTISNLESRTPLRECNKQSYIRGAHAGSRYHSKQKEN